MKQIMLIAVLLLVAANGEASTKLKESWKNPNYSGQPIKTILALVMTKNLETRADFEVALANKMARSVWAMLSKGEDYRGSALAPA